MVLTKDLNSAYNSGGTLYFSCHFSSCTLPLGGTKEAKCITTFFATISGHFDRQIYLLNADAYIVDKPIFSEISVNVQNCRFSADRTLLRIAVYRSAMDNKIIVTALRSGRFSFGTVETGSRSASSSRRSRSLVCSSYIRISSQCNIREYIFGVLRYLALFG